MIRRYSRPRHFTAGCTRPAPAARDEVERLDDHALAAARRSAPPTRRSPSASLAGSVDVHDRVRRRQQQPGVGRAELAPASPCARRGPCRRGRAPSVASRWNGASCRSSSDVDRPAVAPVGVDVPADAVAPRAGTRPASARERRRSSPRAAACSSAGTARGSAARAGRADRGVLRSQQLLRLGRPRHQLAVEAHPVGLELAPRVRRASSALAHAGRAAPLSSAASSKNRRPVRV